MFNVFVYGTLKAGFPNDRFNDGFRVAGEFATATAYPLYLVGERCVPWLMDQPGEGFNVSGELYRVDTPALRRMDLLEDVDEPNGYDRIVIDVRHRETQQLASAYVYIKQCRLLNPDEIREGPLRGYDAEQAARYTPEIGL